MQLKLLSPFPLTETLLSLSLISGALAFSEPCRQGLSYCGSTLQNYHDYSPDDLRTAIFAAPNTPYKSLAARRPSDALFRCDDDQGGVVLKEFCFAGCEQPLNGDSCAAEGSSTG
ncbi:hypothetical protein P170DRAFT_480933 [Aspergillus steynii IBT 23096]|uniref:Uncharacterized protein n=1 Tax=Aspergillus steynii IBT 23096 TaxID=1392250 RepID=A0A2I2FTM0_9EURO|nr:uncharacterized protein P170DRAFT_480933 [Aspergillus steynii IBT 23096]PLB43990.1 hypothetical protein P170DRAFT_480933 [Aspergillus steynii IBT 23096]